MARRVPAQLTLASAALLLALAAAAWLRLKHVIRTRVMPAEDPYTHVLFARELMHRGHFGEPTWLGGYPGLYPPGLSTWHGAFAAMTGLDAYAIAHIAAPLMGVAAVAAVAVVAWRLAGPVAGVAAAVFLAVAPEHVLRTTFFTPTALSLLVHPVVLLAAAEAMRARTLASAVPWFVVLVVGGSAAMLLHPWAATFLAAALCAFVPLRLVLSTAAEEGSAAHAHGIVVVSAALGFAWFATTTGIVDWSPLTNAGAARLAAVAAFVALAILGTHHAAAAVAAGGVALFAAADAMRSILGEWIVPGVTDWMTFGKAALLLTLGAAALFILLLALRFVFANGLRPLPRNRPLTALLATAGVVAALVVFRALRTSAGEPLLHVDYARMLGGGLLFAALAGVAVALPARNDLGLVGLALAAVTVPQTLGAVLDGWHLPHRTMVYVVVAAALLAAALVAVIHDAWTPMRSRIPRASAAWTACVLLVPAVAAAPAWSAQYSWDHLFDEDEFLVIETAAARTGEGDLVLVGSWQANVVARSLAERPWRILFEPDLAAATSDWRSVAQAWGGACVLVLVEPHACERQGDLSFASAEEMRVGGGAALHRLGCA